MVSQKKIDFFVQSGYDAQLIDTLVSFGVDKQLLWFLSQYRKHKFDIVEENIRLVNRYLETPKLRRNNEKLVKKASINESQESETYMEALNAAKIMKAEEDRKEANILYRYANGYTMSMLEPQDLAEEAEMMANCVLSHFSGHVKNKAVAILALKNRNNKTVGHIEIKRNGLIGQNFAKANSELNKFQWNLVLEFFRNNSKNVDTNKLFGETYVAVFSDLFIRDVVLSMPTAVNISLTHNGKEKQQLSGFQVKRFVPSKRVHEKSEVFNTKQDIISFIEEAKENLLVAYNDLIDSIRSTEAGQLYLSDAIKERLFGSSKNAYLMRGEDYNLTELNPDFSISYEGEMPMAEMGEEIIERAAEPAPAPIDEVGYGREEIAVARPRRRVARHEEEINMEAQFGDGPPQPAVMPAPIQFINVRVQADAAANAGLIDANEVQGGGFVEMEIPREGLNEEEVELLQNADIVDITEENDVLPGEIIAPEPFENILARAERREQ